MRLSAHSLILDLLSTLPAHRGSMPVRALIAAGALFGFADNNIRVTLARMRASGSVEADERGQYRLGGHTEAVRQQVVSWRRIQDRLCTWQGGWVGVHTGSVRPDRGRPGRRHVQALRLLGFSEFDRALEIRPDNLAGGVAAMRAQLAELGLDPAARVFALSELDSAGQEQAMGLWDIEGLLESYAAARRELGASSARLSELSEERAMVETFLVGGRVVRQLALDPLLPERMVPAADRAALVSAMQHYDRLGRTCWAHLLARFDVPHLRAPTDLRVASAAAQLPPSDGYEISGGIA